MGEVVCCCLQLETAGGCGCGQAHDVPAVVRLRLATRAAPKERAIATMVKVLVFEWR